LTELGIAGKKADADTLEAATKKRHQDANEVDPKMTGDDNLKDRTTPIDVSVINARTKADAKPACPPHQSGPALDANGKPTGQGVLFDPGMNNGQGGFRTEALPVAAIGMKNTPNPNASQVADEGAVQTQSGMLDQAEQMLKNLPDGGVMEGLKGIAAKVPLVGSTVAGPEKTYQDFTPAFATAVYRAQTGDTRLSDADAAQRAYPLLPALSDTRDVREHKMSIIRDLFNNRQKIVQQQQGVSRNLPGSTITAPPPPSAVPQGGMQSFADEASAHAANLPKGTIVTINGRKARID
jgi:hypothetical protein